MASELISMERNIQKNGLVNLVISLAAGIAAFIVARYTNSLAGIVSVLFLGLGTLVCAVTWFQMRLENSELLEKMEFDELARSRGESALFDGRDSEVFPAQRSREQFEKFFIPIFTVLLCLAEAGGAYFFWKWFSSAAVSTTLRDPMAGMFVFFLVALVLFLVGRFSATYARLENQRLLRPSSSYLLLNAVLCAVVGGGIILVQARFPRADLYVARALSALLALVAIETLIALVLEIYRPRVKGKVGRPLYDSRLVGLLGQPEGLITTAAQAIDYQFGFKVSETWFYRFFERAILWLVPLQILLLVLSTSMVIIEPGEQALLEHFGKPVASRPVLEPGLHFKWPWPVDRIYRFSTEQIQMFDVGFNPEDKEPEKIRALDRGPQQRGQFPRGQPRARRSGRGHQPGRRQAHPSCQPCHREHSRPVSNHQRRRLGLPERRCPFAAPGYWHPRNCSLPRRSGSDRVDVLGTSRGRAGLWRNASRPRRMSIIWARGSSRWRSPIFIRPSKSPPITKKSSRPPN